MTSALWARSDRYPASRKSL